MDLNFFYIKRHCCKLYVELLSSVHMFASYSERPTNKSTMATASDVDPVGFFWVSGSGSGSRDIKWVEKQKLTNNIFGGFFLVGIYIFKSEPSRYTLITKGLEINLVIFWPGSRSNFVDLDSKKELTKTISHSVISNRVGNSDTRFSIRTLKWAGSFFKPQQKF